jgi:hypothetical protein
MLLSLEYEAPLLHDFGEVRQGSRQPAYLVDHHCVDVLGGEVFQEAFQCRAFHGATGKATVVISGRYQLPALVPLAQDVGFARFALRIERVERLLQTLFRRLPSVDGAADPRRNRDRVFSHLAVFRVPKKSGPDQRVPVILRAILERLAYCLPQYSNAASVTLTSWNVPAPAADQPGVNLENDDPVLSLSRAGACGDSHGR